MILSTTPAHGQRTSQLNEHAQLATEYQVCGKEQGRYCSPSRFIKTKYIHVNTANEFRSKAMTTMPSSISGHVVVVIIF